MIEVAHTNRIEDAGVAAKAAIESGAEKAKYTVTVFTDVDCAFCRKFHEEMGELEAKGIAVTNLAFPRGGGDEGVEDDGGGLVCKVIGGRR